MRVPKGQSGVAAHGQSLRQKDGEHDKTPQVRAPDGFFSAPNRIGIAPDPVFVIKWGEETCKRHC